MKTILVCTVVSASVCSALLISSAQAGGHHHALGMSNSAPSTTVTSTGRSPLGEPVFLIPSTSGTGGGPIGGYVPPRAPLPPLQAPPSTSATASLVSSSSTSRSSSSISAEGTHRVAQAELASQSASTGRGTRVFFTPPPTIVGAVPSVTGTGNIAGNNLAVDRVGAQGNFGGSILDRDLESKKSATVATAPVTTVPTGPTVQVPTASSSGGATPWIRITPLQYSAPTTNNASH